MAIHTFSWSEIIASSNKTTIYILTFIASMAISLTVYLQGVIVNPDGILYIDVAKRFVDGDIAAAFEVYDWPFYGILIGLAHQVSTLSYEYSAYLLNSTLVAMACTVFVAIYGEIGTENTRPWLAAILVLALPVLNDYRDLVVRDFGFWAFSLVALLFFIRFTLQSSLGTSLAWQLAAIVAILFRIEGIVFAAAPAIFFLFGTKARDGRLHNILQSSYLFIGLGLIGILGIIGYQFLLTDQRAYTLELWLSYMSPSSIFSQLHGQAIDLKEQLKLLSSTGEATLILAAGLLSLGAFKIATNAVVPYLAIAAYGSKSHWMQSHERVRVVWAFLLLSLLPLAAVLFSKQFLSSRHTVLTVLLISLLTFRYVDIGFQKLQASKKQRWSVIAWGFVALLFLDGVIFSGSSKAIMKTAGQWALENINQDQTWLCNERRLRLYTGDKCEYISTGQALSLLKGESGTFEPGYLLLWISRKDHALQRAIQENKEIIPVNSRTDRKGDRVAIFAIPRAD